MSSDKLFDAIGEISDDMITSALKVKKRSSKMSFAVIMAACLCVALLSVTTVMMLRGTQKKDSGFEYKHDSSMNGKDNPPPQYDNSGDSELPKPTDDPESPDISGSVSDNSNESSVRPPCASAPVTAHVSGNALTLTYQSGAISYTEETLTDNQAYVKDKFITDVTFGDKMWKIYSTREHPDGAVIMLISESGERKIFKSK